MLREITVGVTFLRKLMETKFPADKLDSFTASLTVLLQTRFTGHWNPKQPTHGNAYRSIFTTMEKIDPVLRTAASQADLSPEELAAALPCSLTIWIDPEEVRINLNLMSFVGHSSSQ